MTLTNLKLAWRNLLKHKTFSFVNLAGLAIGVASCVALLLYVRYEWTYDRQFSNYKNIYKVYENQDGGDRVYSLAVTPAVLAGNITKRIPGITRAVRFVDMEPQLLGCDGKQFLRSGLYADSQFFQLLDYHFLHGSSASALSAVHSIVLTKQLALLLFGNTDVLGKLIRFNNAQSLVVSGVMEDLPGNETLQFDFILPWTFNEEQNKWITGAGWGSNNCYTLVELQNQAVFTTVDAELRHTIKANDPNSNSVAFLHPMSKWHLYSKFDNGKVVGGQIEQVRLVGLMAVAILIIACINFTNLSTARSHRKARDVGIRKTIGSSRGGLVWQFFTESFFYAALASVLSISLLFFGLPPINKLLETDLSIPFSDLSFWIGFCIIFVLTGVLAGTYPSLYLSGLKPVKILGNWKGPGRAVLWVRQGLVVFQFTIALFMILAVTVIYLQIKYIHERQTGFDTHHLLEIPLDQTLAQKVAVLKNEIMHSGISGFQCTLSNSITDIWRNGWGIDWPGKKSNEKLLIYFLGVGYHFVETSGLTIVQGRDFSPAYPTDSSAVLINESAASAMQLRHPVGSQIRSGRQQLPIIGVFKDFDFNSPFKKTPPLIVFLGGNNASFLDVRLTNAAKLGPSIRKLDQILKTVNPGYPTSIRFVDQNFEQNFTKQRLMRSIIAVFGVLAIIISCLGLLGLAMFAAEIRRKEISIRRVLGANVYQIATLLSTDFVKLVLLSALISFPLGWLTMNSWLQQFDYRISINVWLFFAVILFAFVIAQVTMMTQTLKAATEKPVNNLKGD
jgi:putative ABC transport system permease protein